MKKITHTKITKYFGKDRHGNRYFLGRDLYVYQRLSSMEFNGWISSFTAWDNAIYKIIV